MTQAEMKSQLALTTGESDDDILSAYLNLAGEKILNKMYQCKSVEDREVPVKYQYTQLEIAAYLINKRGAEGETAHNENGINRAYESASVPDSMLKHVLPFFSAF